MNRLAHEPSPYLRQHAANPVEWYPWGPEALERARVDRRPILLSVGYSACHWCHVMAHESFEDPKIAAQMNAQFVNVKVDREERPDLDQLYQGVVQLMGKGGGWPLTVFLTPDLRPFFGGTYFPKEDRYGMPGFGRLLDALSKAWGERPNDVEQQAQAFKEGLTQYTTDGLAAAPSEPTRQDILTAARYLSQALDPVHGGFGGAPKFPNPMNLALLLRGVRRGDARLLEGALLALEKMARGGVYDQLGGGFHRYSVDAQWRVPHFEKMLYDNAQLIHLYAEAYQLRPRPLWKAVVEQTVEWVAREMTSPSGAFFAAQDADSEGEEGRFFAWTPAELDAALPPDLAKVAKRYHRVTDEGTFEAGKSVLEAGEGATVEEVAAIRAALFAAREKRIRPGLDDKVLTSWNGLMIRALAFAGRVFERPDWVAAARRAADFLLDRAFRGERLFHAVAQGEPRLEGLLEDHGDLALGLLGLYEATFEPRYLEAAERLAASAEREFWDGERQAYLAAPRGRGDLLVPTYALHDNAFPSGASTLAHALASLAALTGRAEHLETAGRYLRRMRHEALRNPFGYGHLLLAMDAYLDGAAQVTIVAPTPQWPRWETMLARTYAPTVAVCFGPLGFTGKAQAGAYFCARFACDAPVDTPEALKARLETFGA